MSKIKDQITEASWMKGNFYSNDARYNINDSLEKRCQRAERCCLEGWIYRVYGNDAQVFSLVKSQLPEGFHNIAGFNDNAKTTFQDILALVQKADV